MNGETHQNNQLRNYLLGKITHEEEREKIEDRMMRDDDFFEELTIVETEIIEDYVNHRLAADEIENFRKHFLVSAERREKIKFAQALRYHIEGKTKPFQQTAPQRNSPNILFFFRNRFAVPVFAILILLVSAGIYLFLKSADDDKILAQLNKAYKTERPFDARISGLDYAPINNRRGGNDSPIDVNAQNYAERLSLDALDQAQTAQSLHNLGRVYLAEKNFDEAIKQLEASEKIDAGRAKVLSDLGTAYLEKGKTLASDNGKRMELTARSLEYFVRALKIEPALPEALFNRALCFQYLNLPRQAREAWDEYLKIDSSSAWAEEARRNQQMINSSSSQSNAAPEIIRDFLAFYDRSDHENAWQKLSRNREMITGKLIPQQLAVSFLEAEGNEKAKYLAALKYAGELSRQRSGDPFFAEMAKFYAEVPAEKFELLRAAQTAIKKGYELCVKNDFRGALDSFKVASQNFAAADSLNELELAEYWISYCDFQLGDIKQSSNNLKSLAIRAEKKNHQWLLATALSRLANNYTSIGDHSKCISYNENSLKIAEQIDDLYLQQKTLSQISDEYKELKRADKAFEYVQKSFRLFEFAETSPRQKWRTYQSAAQLFIQAKFYSAAVSVNQESLKLNEEQIQEGTFTYWNYYQLSQIYGAQKIFDSALQNADRSIAAAESLKDAAQRAKGTAVTFLNLAHLLRQSGNCEEALAGYDRALELFHSIEFSVENYDAEKGRLLCYAEKQDQASLADKLPKVLQMFEQNRAKILEEQNRNTFFDQEQSVYDLAIDYEAKIGNHERAFDYSEQSRSRSLLDLQKNGAQVSLESETPQIVFGKEISRPLELSVLQARMPDKTKLIQYAVVKDRVLIWLVSKDNFRQYVSEAPAEVLKQAVENFLQAIQVKDTNRQKELSQQLYWILFQPIENDLNPNDEICLIPDKILSHLPFAALISARTGNYLLADYKLLTAPSANVFLISSENARRFERSDTEKVLSVGNPIFDRREFSSLSLLPSARREAITIADYYASSKPLLETEATKATFLKKFPEADIVHFAGHYVVNENAPMLSGFLMTGNGKEGTLTNYELLSLNSSKAKLIVLSACETGIEKYYDGEGMIGAGRTFLALGVPLIVASQWQVDSEATAELMSEFHHRRTQDKISTVEALRLAQLGALRSEREDFRQPFYWAGFGVIGGSANF